MHAAAPQASVVVSSALLSLIEGGANGTFTVVLGARPTANVTITLASNNSDVATVSPTTLTFAATGFNTSQTVTVSAANNARVDGVRAAQITLTTASTDAAFRNLTVPRVVVQVTNDDTVSAGTGGVPALMCHLALLYSTPSPGPTSRVTCGAGRACRWHNLTAWLDQILQRRTPTPPPRLPPLAASAGRAGRLTH